MRVQLTHSLRSLLQRTPLWLLVRGKSVSAWLTAGIWRRECRLQSCICQVAKAPGRTKRVGTCAVQPGYFRALLLVFCLIISVSALQAIRWMLSRGARADVIQRSTLMAVKQTVLSSNPWELSLCKIPFVWPCSNVGGTWLSSALELAKCDFNNDNLCSYELGIISHWNSAPV